jgi:hypothetical protein
MTWIVLPATVGAIGLGVALARRAERTRAKALVAALVDSSRRITAASGHIDDAALPTPVRRYLAHVLRPGQPAIRLAELRQTGLLRTDVDSGRWMRFCATQTVAPPACGFVWSARVSVAPGLHVDVRDALVRGEGTGRVSVMSAIPVARAEASPQMNAGALHRYLAEAVWYPTALRPSTALRWSPIDADRALATLTVSGTSVSLEFRFGADGEATGVHTGARWGRFGGRYEQRPWEGHFGRTVERDGLRVPAEGEVGWYVGDDWRRVWTGRIVAARYTFAT